MQMMKVARQRPRKIMTTSTTKMKAYMMVSRERADGVGDLLRPLENELHLHVRRERGRDGGQSLSISLDDIDRIGARLLLDHDTHAALAVHALVHRRLLERVADLGDVAQHDRPAAPVRRGPPCGGRAPKSVNSPSDFRLKVLLPISIVPPGMLTFSAAMIWPICSIESP